MPVTRTTFANISPTDWTNRTKPKPKQERFVPVDADIRSQSPIVLNHPA
jgi:hypothetical protein